MAKKAISPVVAVVILIALAVTIGGMVSSWITSFVQKSSQQDTCAITTMYTLSQAVHNSSSGKLSIKVRNTGRLDIYNFTVEADNGTKIVVIPADSPDANYRLGPGKTQYVLANTTGHNITAIQTVTVLVKSCPGYAPSPVTLANI